MIRRRKSPVHFHFIYAGFYFPGRTRLKAFILSLFKKEGYLVDRVDYIFCTDNYLLNINQKYLGHNTYTDIISFGLSKGKEAVIAEIYISVERVKENAEQFRSGFMRELHRVIFHGALHLCGYKDKAAADIKIMRSKEELYLNRYFVSRGTRLKKS